MAILGRNLNEYPEAYDNLLSELIKFSGEEDFWKDLGQKTMYLPNGEMFHNLFEYERGYSKGNENYIENLLAAVVRAKSRIERGDPEWSGVMRLEVFIKQRLKSLPYFPFLEMVKDFPPHDVIHQIIEVVFKNQRPLAALSSSPDKKLRFDQQKEELFGYADSMQKTLQAPFLSAFLAHFNAINPDPQNLKYRLRLQKAIEEYLAKQLPTIIGEATSETSQSDIKIDIDISKLVTETLKDYPSCNHLQRKFETLLKGHYEVLQNQVENGLRVGGLNVIRSDYENVLTSHETNLLLKDWSKFNVFNGGSVEEHKAEREVDLHFFQAAFDWLDKNISKDGVEKQSIKGAYCCTETLKILEDLVELDGVGQMEVGIFEDFFVQHPYTNLNEGNVYRDKTTLDLDFEKLLLKVFEVASLLEGDIQDYFFICFCKDAESQNRSGIRKTDYHILIKKVKERRKVAARSASQIPLLGFDGLFENDKAMGKAISAAFHSELISDKGKWIFTGAKTFAASSFWKAAVTAGLGKADIAKAKVAKLIGEHFGVHLNKNSISTTTGDYDEGLYVNLLAAMKSNKTNRENRE